MKKLKEITAQMANELTHKSKNNSFERHKKFFMQRIKKIAENGEYVAHFSTNEYDDWKEISEWLSGLGFHVTKPVNGVVVYVKWGDEHLAKLEKFKTDYSSNSKSVKDDKAEQYCYHWVTDCVQWDYICSCCNEHSEYKTKYCPNCGAKMYIGEDENGA